MSPGSWREGKGPGIFRGSFFAYGSALGSGCSGLYGPARDLRFGAEPIIEFVAGLVAALFVEFMRAAADLVFQLSRFADWFGALVIPLGFAAGGVTGCEPLHVSQQLIRFGAFLRHAHSLT
jgi:hypothetical protein